MLAPSVTRSIRHTAPALIKSSSIRLVTDTHPADVRTAISGGVHHHAASLQLSRRGINHSLRPSAALPHAPTALAPEVCVVPHKADPQLVSRCVSTIADALSQDALTTHCFKPGAGVGWIKAFTQRQIWLCPEEHQLYTIGDADAVAQCFMYPSEQPIPFWKNLVVETLDWFSTLVRMKAEHLADVSDFFTEVLHARRDEFAQDHGRVLLLQLLAVRPGMQGQGLGSKLLTHLTQKADAEGTWMYLESSAEGNYRLYKRFGFQDVDKVQVIPGVEWTIMARAPTKKTSAADSSPAV